MLFNSIEFILFLATFFVSVILFKNKFRLIVIIFSSIFYAYWSFKFLILLYLIIFLSHWLGNLIFKSKNKIYYLIFYTLVVVSLLIYFKYGEFFLQNLDNFSKIILPIGISFYLFQSISYLVDIYRNRIKGLKKIFEVLIMKG